MRTKSLKVYPRDLDRLRALCRPGQTPAGALAELLDGAEQASPPDPPGSWREHGVLIVPLGAAVPDLPPEWTALNPETRP